MRARESECKRRRGQERASVGERVRARESEGKRESECKRGRGQERASVGERVRARESECKRE